MDPRISTLESDVAAVRASVEAVHSNYATNLQLAEVQANLKLEIVRNSEQLDHKIDTVAAAMNARVDSISAAMKLEYNKANADMSMEFNRANADMRMEFNKANADMRMEFNKANADMRMEFSKAHAELRVDVRNWVLATVVGLFVAFGGMAYMMYNIATRAV